METFAAVRLHVDSWRWAGVPFYIRAGKCLPATATEIRVELKHPPKDVFDRLPPSPNYVRFRLSPDVVISLGSRVKLPGEDMVGEVVELMVRHCLGDEMRAYERLLGRCHRGRSHALRTGGRSAGGLGDRRARAPRARPGARVRAWIVGAARSRRAHRTGWRVGQPDGRRTSADSEYTLNR